jgi:hypothetical protein
MSRSIRFVPLLCLLALAPGCGDDEPETPISPTPPPTVTENFSGSINQNGAMTHPFSTALAGTVTATLTTVSPNSATVIGMSLGTWNGAVCQIILANDKATQGTIVVGTVSTFGSLCLRMYDVGGLTQPTSYEVQIVHP